MTTSHTERLMLPRARHDCSPALCSRGPREIAHREVPEQWTPHNDGDPNTTTFSWGLERHVDLDTQGAEAGTEVRAAVGLGSELTSMGLDELAGYWRALAELEQRGRDVTAAPPDGW